MDFFKINGRTIKPPKNIGHSVEILDKVERTLNGTMVVDKVGMKKKIDVSWDYLDIDNMKILQEEIIPSAKGKGNEWDIDDDFYGDSQYDDGDFDFDGFQDLSFDDGSMF
jgi:hypothetical protein